MSGAVADRPVEFRQCAKHLKNQPALRRRRIEGFGQTAKPNGA
jgi:hypothetical protein